MNTNQADGHNPPLSRQTVEELSATARRLMSQAEEEVASGDIQSARTYARKAVQAALYADHDVKILAERLLAEVEGTDTSSGGLRDRKYAA